MIKGSIQEKDITIINIYAPNIGALQYVRQILTNMKREINSTTIIVGDFNSQLTPMDIVVIETLYSILSFIWRSWVDGFQDPDLAYWFIGATIKKKKITQTGKQQKCIFSD